MQIILVLLAIFATSLVGFFVRAALPVVGVLSLGGLIYMLWRGKQKGFRPQSAAYKEIEKLKKRRQKVEDEKHKRLSDQIEYIDGAWGYTKEQTKIIEKHMSKRAYAEIYNKLTASLLPQIIELVNRCNEKERVGCKREVNKRIRELTEVMKGENKKSRDKQTENFETTLEVYDRLLKELK